MILGKILSWFLIFSFFVFALIVFINAQNNKLRMKAGIISLTICLWLTSFDMLGYADTIFEIRFWAKSIFVSVALIFWSVYWFSLEFYRDKTKGLRIRNIILMLLNLIIICLLIFSEKCFGDFNIHGNSLIQKAPNGPWFPACIAVYLMTIIGYGMNLVVTRKRATGIIKTQISYVFYTSILASLFSLTTGAILPVICNVEMFLWLTPYGAVIYMTGITYTIFRYRLLDIEIIIKRTTIYITLVGIITSIYAFLLLLPQRFIGAPGSPGSVLIMILAAIVLAITLQPLREWLDEVTDRFFYQKKYDYSLLLEKTSGELTTVLKIEDVLNIIVKNLLDTMHINNIGFYVREKLSSGVFVCHKAVGTDADKFPAEVQEDHPLTEILTHKRGGLEAGEFRHMYGHLYSDGRMSDPMKAEIQRMLDDDFQKGLLMPLLLKTNLIGFMVLGEKLSGELYTYRDLTMLETLGNQISTAIENIRLYEQMLNNERLTIIGTMAAGIAHEIRNPLASIKTFVQMLPEKYTRTEFRKRFEEIVPAEIERLSAITADLLTFSKPSTPSLGTVDAKKLVDRVVTLINNQVRKKQLTVEKNLEEGIEFQADEQQIFQVLLNLLLNAIHASKSGNKIWIKTEVKKGHNPNLPKVNDFLYLEVQDEGHGIKRKDYYKLFQPFFTTKPEGTGLGLATCKRIIEAHSGRIIVESEENKGSRFILILPMNLTPEMITKVAS